MKFLDVTVKEAATGLLVGVEVACWFYMGKFQRVKHGTEPALPHLCLIIVCVVGEIIGRGSLIGYAV